MDWKNLSDQQLVELCIQGHQQAWVEFVRRFQPLVGGVVSRTIRRWRPPDRSLVDELVQEILLKLCKNEFRALRNFQWLHENSLPGFLKVVSSNAVQDHFRKNRMVEESLGDDEAGKVPAVTPVRGVETEALLQKLVSCLQRLLNAETDHSQSVAIFLLYYRQGLTAKEISRLYPLTVKAVENTLLRLVRMAKARCI